MEYEISDLPGEDEQDAHDERKKPQVVEDHIALQNQSSVTPDDYPTAERAAQSLVRAKKPEKK